MERLTIILRTCLIQYYGEGQYMCLPPTPESGTTFTRIQEWVPGFSVRLVQQALLPTGPPMPDSVTI